MPATDYSKTSQCKPYKEQEDMPWDQKRDRLYWVGGTTDGSWHDDRF